MYNKTIFNTHVLKFLSSIISFNNYMEIMKNSYVFLNININFILIIIILPIKNCT